MALPTDPKFNTLSESFRKTIDDRSYEALLYQWRFAPSGSDLFVGLAGEYYSAVMFAKKAALADNGVSASKNVGWER